MLAAFLVVVSVVLGGASQRHEFNLLLVELAAVPLLCVALYKVCVSATWERNRALLVLLALLISLPIYQIIPLPPEIWTTLPGREQSVLALELIGQTPRWGTLSMTPDATRASLWALIPPSALLLGMTLMNGKERLLIAGVFLAGAVASILFSFAQLAAGGESLYLYSQSNPGDVVGFSANRNHLATLVLMGLPVAAAIGATPWRHHSSRDTAGQWLFGLYAIVAIIAVGLTRSRTGTALAAPVLIASFFVLWHATRQGSKSWKSFGVSALAALGVAAVATFGLEPLLDRFETLRDGPDLRFLAWPVVIEAGNTLQPWGAGLGAFDPVYRSVEPLSELGPRFWNRAHNDYLELWLEAGILGIILVVAILVWFARAWVGSWLAPNTQQAPTLARAVGIAILVVASHSVVDYPLRTETIAVFLAFCFGALTPAADTAASRR